MSARLHVTANADYVSAGMPQVLTAAIAWALIVTDGSVDIDTEVTNDGHRHHDSDMRIMRGIYAWISRQTWVLRINHWQITYEK